MALPEIWRVAFGGVLKPIGFKQKAATWYFQTDETISLLNLQCEWETQYFVNLAVWLNWLEEPEKVPPYEYKCHIRGRWTKVIDCDERDLSPLLDLENVMLSDEVRIAEIQRLLSEHIVPFFSCTQTREGLRSLRSLPIWRRLFVNLDPDELP